eukprot:Pgem_evm1s7409
MLIIPAAVNSFSKFCCQSCNCVASLSLLWCAGHSSCDGHRYCCCRCVVVVGGGGV